MSRFLATIAVLVCVCAALFARAPAGAASRPASPALPAAAERWVRATQRRMTLEEKAGQLIWDRTDARYYNEGDKAFVKMKERVRKLHLGGYIIFGWGTPTDTAAMLNALQRAAKIPLLIGADFERGPAMRVPPATEIPDNMAIAATGDTANAAFAAAVTAREARAMGVQWVYAPVSDVNVNPDNPVINTRSFGEDPRMVARMVEAYVRAAERGGVLATAKHFPGHGDTAVDSHLALATVSGNRARLERVELVPFRAAIDAGISTIMTAHLAVPAVEPDTRLPATLSKNVLTGLLRDELGFKGLIATDALEMGGVTNNYWPGEIAVRAVQAGADCLLLPTDPEVAERSIVRAVKTGRISMKRLNESVERILRAKARLGLYRQRLVDLAAVDTIVASPEAAAQVDQIANRSITLVRDERNALPFRLSGRKKLLAVLFTDDNGRAGEVFTRELRQRVDTAEVVRVPANVSEERSAEILQRAAAADEIIAGLFIRVVTAKGTVGMPAGQAALMKQMVEAANAAGKPLAAISFGNPYLVRAFPEVRAYLCAFSAADASERAGVRALFGEIPVSGHLPVTIPGIARLGSGIERAAVSMKLRDETASQDTRFRRAFDVVDEWINERAFPGAALAVGYRGALVALKGFGHFDYSAASPAVTSDTIYDLASVSKVVGTTTAAMMLYERGDLLLDIPVVRYIPEFAGPYQHDIITVRQLLTHSSGLPPYEKLFLQYSGKDELFRQICATPLAAAPGQKYAYSDFGIILIGEIIERITGQTLDKFLRAQLFDPLGMTSTEYKPGRELLPRIPPTEQDPWRGRLVRGEVHDENCFAYGGVCGHAGLFSSARDLAAFAQMMLNGGTYDGKRILKRSTVEMWTALQANQPPRGTRALGWDTPEPQDSFVGDHFSSHSFIHTGFTGTSIAVDPDRELFVILLTNRVHPTRENHRIAKARPAIHNAVVEALQ